MKMKIPSVRFSYFIGFILTSFAVLIPVLLQIYADISPCPLCILQRIALALVGIVFFFGAVMNLRRIGLFICGALACCMSALGILLSGRQVWLQHFPPLQGNDCVASLQYMLSIFSPLEVLKKVLIGGAECSQIDGRFLTLSLAEWSLIFFIGLFIFSFWQLCRNNNPNLR